MPKVKVLIRFSVREIFELDERADKANRKTIPIVAGVGPGCLMYLP